MFNAKFNANKNTSAVDSQIACQSEGEYMEVSGIMDDFISIEEFAPGSDWEDVLAATWGLPCVEEPVTRSAFSGLKELGLRSVRSILQSLRSKKFEVA
jgi:hypothetical protein